MSNYFVIPEIFEKSFCFVGLNKLFCLKLELKTVILAFLLHRDVVPPVCWLHVCLSSVLRHGRVQSVHSAAVHSLHVLLRRAFHLYRFRSVQLHQWVSVFQLLLIQFTWQLRLDVKNGALQRVDPGLELQYWVQIDWRYYTVIDSLTNTIRGHVGDVVPQFHPGSLAPCRF